MSVGLLPSGDRGRARRWVLITFGFHAELRRTLLIICRARTVGFSICSPDRCRTYITSTSARRLWTVRPACRRVSDDTAPAQVSDYRQYHVPHPLISVSADIPPMNPACARGQSGAKWSAVRSVTHAGAVRPALWRAIVFRAAKGRALRSIRSVATLGGSITWHCFISPPHRSRAGHHLVDGGCVPPGRPPDFTLRGLSPIMTAGPAFVRWAGFAFRSRVSSPRASPRLNR